MNLKALILFALLAAAISAPAATQKTFQYVGSKACGECHQGEAHGNQYTKWLSSRHNVAYWRLATTHAKHIVSTREQYKGITEPIKADRCLKCHSTGRLEPGAEFASTSDVGQGVGCEACHGPGSEYMEQSIMEDREKFLANGGVIPDEKTCLQCHNEEEFQFEEWFQKIAHPKP